MGFFKRDKIAQTGQAPPSDMEVIGKKVGSKLLHALQYFIMVICFLFAIAIFSYSFVGGVIMILAAVCICPKIKQLKVPWKWTDDMRRKLQTLGCSSCFLLAFIIMGVAGFNDGSSTPVDTGSDINRSIPVVDDDIQTTTTTELTTTSTTTTTTTTATTTAETTTEETSTVVTTTEIITTEPPTEPPTDPPPPPQTVAQRSYVVNTNSGKVHYPDCNSVDDMLEENKWYYTGTFAELEGMGYTSCGRCHAR